MKTIDTPAKGTRTDLFDAVNYTKRVGKSGTVHGHQSPRHFEWKWSFDVPSRLVTTGRVPASFLDDIRSRIQQNRSEFRHLNKLVLEDVIGIDRWSEYDSDEKRAAGACVAYLYQSGQVPLELLDFELDTTNSLALVFTR